MAQLVFLVGRSGLGKSSAIRTLNPEETIVINSDKKALPFKKFNEKYNEKKGNYLKTSKVSEVISKIKEGHGEKNVKYIVIDTMSRLMTDLVQSSGFKTAKDKFGKWDDLASGIYDLINIINDKLRDDIIVYVMAHPEVQYDDGGVASERIAVQGKKLEKYTIESFSTIVLYADILKAPGKPNRHIFRTLNSNNSGKTPMEMFDEEFIDNDLQKVSESIREYYGI